MENKLKMGSYSLERKQDTWVAWLLLFVWKNFCGMYRNVGWFGGVAVVLFGVVCCCFLDFIVHDFIFEVLFRFFAFSPCCVFVKFSREYCEFHEFLEIESFGETHTHTQATAWFRSPVASVSPWGSQILVMGFWTLFWYVFHARTKFAFGGDSGLKHHGCCGQTLHVMGLATMCV